MSQPSPSNTELKILLVENSRTARTILIRQLQHEGYSVEAVGTGLEAIEAILKSDFNLVIMDIFLPQMNGYEAARRIRAIDSYKSNIPLIVLTASTKDSDKRTCLEAGMNEYVIKSTDNEELLAVLATYQKNLRSGKDKPSKNTC